MYLKFKGFSLVIGLIYFSSSAYASENLIASGSLSCFKKGEAHNPKLSCEFSTATAFQNTVIISNDKADRKLFVYNTTVVEERGSHQQISADKVITFPPEYNVAKIESSASFDGWVFAVSAYDRIGEGLDPYSRIIAFRYDPNTNDAKDFQIIAGLEAREPIAKLVGVDGKEASYFKIEATTILPSEKEGEGEILFGIREAGDSYKEGQFKYNIKNVSTKIKIENGKIKLLDDWKLVYDMTDEVPGKGIFSLDYDANKQVLYMTTSLERGDEFSADLWSISLAEFRAKRPFRKIESSLFDGHKVEGIAILPSGHLFLVADDDCVKTKISGKERELWEAAYWVIDPKFY